MDTQNGVERDLTVDEALQLQTYQAALKGSRMAIRTILRMIAKRESWLAQRRGKPKPTGPATQIIGERDTDNAHAAMRLLGIALREVLSKQYAAHVPIWLRPFSQRKCAAYDLNNILFCFTANRAPSGNFR